ncbi:MAG: histidine decarboxylase [Bacteroidetes bacterium]|nr:histidine decarboxylase [Bacteroidota bacterium]
MPNEQDTISSFLARVEERSRSFIGYPASKDFNYEELFPFLHYNLNNIGDPMSTSHCDMHTREFEQYVLQFFARLFHAPQNDWWGYMTHGGTEGNLYGLFLARELYPGAMVYYSEATHYSMQKNIHLLGMPSIVIRCRQNGEMDYDDLEQIIQHYRHKPAIVIANIGTTMTEAKDHVPMITNILKKYAIRDHYVHCDAALAGPYLALLNHDNFDFRFGADSIAISGHKFIGSPIPCGVVLVKKSNKDRISRSVSYIGSYDATIAGSRNAIAPLFMWYTISKLGKEGLLQRALQGIALADYAIEQLRNVGIEAWKNENALTVVFEKQSKTLCSKWQLASDAEWSHLICMPGVTREQIDDFVADCTMAKKEEEVVLEF